MNPVTDSDIQQALSSIGDATDPTIRQLELASLVSAIFRERGIELVVVGGSAIEFYTDGQYASGDLDMCLISPTRLGIRTRQELMGRLGAKGGPRSWQVAGQYVDILGELETLSQKPLEILEAPYGLVRLIGPEDLLVERVLISIYPQRNETAGDCARKLAAVAIAGQVEMDWNEADRLAARPEYGILPELRQMINNVAHELEMQSPYPSQDPPDNVE